MKFGRKVRRLSGVGGCSLDADAGLFFFSCLDGGAKVAEPAARRAAATHMRSEPRKRLHHEPPDWVRPEADFFITVCAANRGTNQFCTSITGPIVLESIQSRHQRGAWFCHLAVLMPDHVHLLLSFPPEKTMSRTMSEWKAWLARHQGISWQRNFFDHRLRSETDRHKGEYILANPVRAGYVSKWEEWPYFWMPGCEA